MDDKLMYNPNDDKQNYFFYRLNYWWKISSTTSVEPTNHNSINIPKVFELENKTLGTSDMYCPMAFQVQSMFCKYILYD